MSFLGPKLSEICLRQGKHYLVAGGVCEEVVSGCGTGTCSCRGHAVVAVFWYVVMVIFETFFS